MTVQSSRHAAGHSMPPAPCGRPLIGGALAVIGVVHVLITPLLYGDAVRSVLDAGVFAAIDADPALTDLRGAGFWYASAGIILIALGVVVGWAERRLGTVPAALGWLLLGFGVWGVVLMPVSPFWVFLILAALTFRSSRRRNN